MQYTFGDMIGELFMKALMLEEQRKVREEEKNYKNEVMQYQRGRDQVLDQRYTSDKNTSDQRYKDAYGLQLAQNQREIDQNNRMEIDTRINRRSKLTPLDQALITKYKLNPENYPTGEGWEKEFQDPNIFTDPKLESQRYILDDELARLNDSWYKDQTLSRMGYSSNPDNRKVEFYKYDKDGNLLQTILASPNEMKNTYLNPNDKNWKTNKDYIFSSQPAMGNLLLNQQKFAKGQNNKYSTEAGIYSALSQAMGNMFANKFSGLAQLQQDNDFLSQFTPGGLLNETSAVSNVMVPGALTQNTNDDTRKKFNNQKWGRQKTANAQFIRGLLEETINPLAEVLEFLKSNAKTSTDVKGLQQIGATLGAMYPELDRMRMLFDKGMINDPDNELKKKFYEGLRKAQRYWQTESVLSQAIYNQKFKSKLQDAEIKNKIESIQD